MQIFWLVVYFFAIVLSTKVGIVLRLSLCFVFALPNLATADNIDAIKEEIAEGDRSIGGFFKEKYEAFDDLLSGLKEIKICIGYKQKGTDNTKNLITHIPANTLTHYDLEPVYEVFEGFNQDISKVTTFKELPTACQKFLLRIQDLTCVKISLVSVGAERNQNIILHEI